ncbi:MAG: response regulator [Pseudomonadota bacterium]
MKRSLIFPSCRRWLLAVVAVVMWSASALASAPPVAIGVLAKRGLPQCLDEWTPTARYLTERIPGAAFTIIPIAYADIYEKVRTGGLDFILTNPSFYVELERWYGVNRIATLKGRCVTGVCKTYGGVIFWLNSRADIRGLADLKGKRFMAANEYSLGGWRIVWRELLERGLDPYRDFADLRFGDTHDDAVLAVLSGAVDAGSVRTDILERMQAEGKIRLTDFRILEGPPDALEPLPFLCSTRQYPEWPLAKLRHTSDALAEKVTVALLQMAADDPAARAANCAGWTIPLNYQSVHECLRFLKVGPYADLGRISASDVLKSYWQWILAAVLAFAGGGLFTGVILRLNRNIRESHRKLQAEIAEHRKTDDALKTAKEMAEAATRAKSDFLANMSHEIRTPMNGVIAAAELVMQETLPSKARHYLKIIYASAGSLLGLLNDILDFSKIEAGKMTMETRPFLLDEVVDRVVDLFIHSAAERRIEIMVDIGPDAPRALKGDPLRLQQILTNLVGNAVKFTGEGGCIMVGVRLQETAGDESVLTFWVKDTGVGIPPDYLALLFQPFTQADASDTRRYQGTGLGLSICKRLVEMMHGRIWVDSRQGEGSTFSFTVRFVRQARQPEQAFVLPTDLTGRRVLVVDDSADCRAVVTSMLDTFGFRVETAADGRLALDRLQTDTGGDAAFSLVIMDWVMPEMDGLSACRRLRETIAPELPIIMMTAFGGESEKREAEKLGVKVFLTKPVYRSTLFAAVLSAFGKQAPEGASGTAGIGTDLSAYKRDLKGFRVLVVEDNPTNREIAQAVLETAGMLVETAENGRMALARVREAAFDAVLMDVQMPEMNGLEATRVIRSDPVYDRMPIVAMTAHAMRGDEERCLAAGMDGYLSKPINQQRLFHLLWRLLKNRRPGAGGAPTPGQTQVPVITGDRLPDAVAGLSIAATLSAMDLSPVVYLKILAGFAENNAATADELRQAIATGDRTRLAGLAHALKGSAGNIGAGELETAARDLETAARGAHSEEALRLSAARVVAALDIVSAGINGLQAGRAAPPETRPGPVIADRAILTALSAALAQADPLAVEAAAGPVLAALSRSDAGRLRRFLAGYDYEQALSLIDRILQDVKADAAGRKDP